MQLILTVKMKKEVVKFKKDTILKTYNQINYEYQ